MSSQPADPTIEERERVIELVRQHGWNATAFQTLESGYSYWFAGADACVAYVDTGSAWVAAGAPIAAPEALARVAAAFVASASAAGKRCCFFGSEDRLRVAAQATLSSFCVGEQPVWRPSDWTRTVLEGKSLREQLRRARAKGVRTRRLTAAELELEPIRAAIADVAERWLRTRRMERLDFLVKLEPFALADERCCFVAEQGGRVVAFALLAPVPARRGWLLENLVRDPAAPNGTAELLVDGVMRWAAASGAEWLTLGLAPLSGDVARPLRLARRAGRFLYDFRGLRAYKAKLGPRAWCAIFVSHPDDQSALVALFDVLVAFSGVGLVRFAARSLALRLQCALFQSRPWPTSTTSGTARSITRSIFSRMSRMAVSTSASGTSNTSSS